MSNARPTPAGRGRGPGHGPGPRPTIIQKPKDLKTSVVRILKYVGNNKILLISGLVCVILSTILGLVGTSLMEPVVDGITKSAVEYAKAVNLNDDVAKELALSSGLTTLFKNLALLATVYVGALVTSFLQVKFMIYLSQRTTNKIRKDMFDALETLPVRYYDTHTNGEIMSRFTNDVDTLNEALNHSITSLFSSAITIVGTLILMFSVCWPLAIVTLVLTPLSFIVAGFMIKRSSKYFKKQQKNIGAVNSYIEEIVAGQKVVKTFCYEDRVTEEFYKRNEELRDTATNAQMFAGMMMPIMANINNVTYAIIAMFGGCIALGFLPVNVGLTIGGLTVFLNLARHFGRPINEISSQYNNIITAVAGAERIFDIMDELPETADKPDAVEITDFKGHVIFDNVTFGYNPDKIVLKNLSLYAKPGQKIAFVGSTGAGKTTITNLLTRFYDTGEGSITIDGVDIRDIKRDSLRESIAMVLQDTHLFSGTVRENIRYGRLNATDEEVEEAAKLASAHSFINRLPKGYDTMIEGDGENLSQGQRQLLNIARAAVANTPILVLDEATSSVDTRTERHIEKGLDRLMKGKTTFVIAHRLSTVRNSNAIMVLEKGEIIERGTHEQLLELKGRYYELYTGAVELD